MSKITWLLTLLLLTVHAFGQKAPAKKAKPMANQGICGTVLELKGNHMPGPDKPMPKGQPVVREVVIYPLLTMEQVKMDDEGFIQDVPGINSLQTVRSDKQGKFCAYKLPAGRYSVLVRESKGLYANLFDLDGRINAQTVRPGKVTQTTVEITHQAAF
jgi:hypothetical protein